MENFIGKSKNFRLYQVVDKDFDNNIVLKTNCKNWYELKEEIQGLLFKYDESLSTDYRDAIIVYEDKIYGFDYMNKKLSNEYEEYTDDLYNEDFLELIRQIGDDENKNI